PRATSGRAGTVCAPDSNGTPGRASNWLTDRMTCSVCWVRHRYGYRGEVATVSASWRPDADRASNRAQAWFPGIRAGRAVECVELPGGADRVRAGGFWAVVGDFEGPVRAWRFADVDRGAAAAVPTDHWTGPDPRSWRTTLVRDAYLAAVGRAREHIPAGGV